MENVIQYLEDEIDSLKSAYKSSLDNDSKTIYSTKILEFQKAIKILKDEELISDNLKKEKVNSYSSLKIYEIPKCPKCTNESQSLHRCPGAYQKEPCNCCVDCQEECFKENIK